MLSGHVIVCGLDSLGIRLVEELRRLGEDVVVIADEVPSDRLAAASRAGASIIRGHCRDGETMLRAGLATARALALVEQDDVGNLHSALRAQEINGGLRIVMRLFHESLQRSAEALLHNSVALSASGIAAPLFVAAALGEEEGQRFEVGGHGLVVAEAHPSDDTVVVPLARPGREGHTVLLPTGVEAGDLALVDAGQAANEGASSAKRARRGHGGLAHRAHDVRAAVGAIADRRFRWLLAAILIVMLISVLVFSLFAGLNVLDALYFTVTTITTTGYGDISLLHQPLAVKLYVIALIVTGATMLALFYAILIDATVGVRLTRALGGVRGQIRDHVVVCGLGNVGSKVVTQLVERGIPVVAVERDEDSRAIPTARRLGVPVVLADASLEESLRSARVESARCLLAVTDDDVTNLEAALNARHLCPEMPVVLRLFDHDLAARVDRTFSISASRSVSALAAPAFAAALVDRRVISVIPVGRRVLVVAEVAIEPGSMLDGVPMTAVDEPERVRALCLRSGDGSITWSGSTPITLSAGDSLTVVATRQGLAQVLKHSGASMATGRVVTP